MSVRLNLDWMAYLGERFCVWHPVVLNFFDKDYNFRNLNCKTIVCKIYH
jgi:hypothetical protein